MLSDTIRTDCHDSMCYMLQEAHKMLFDMYKDLDSQSIPVPRELEETLMLLHSYVLVKVHALCVSY